MEGLVILVGEEPKVALLLFVHLAHFATVHLEAVVEAEKVAVVKGVLAVEDRGEVAVRVFRQDVTHLQDFVVMVVMAVRLVRAVVLVGWVHLLVVLAAMAV